MAITGNKGEWSEIYTFLRLLADGRLFAADEKLSKIRDMFFPVMKVIREENSGHSFEYKPVDTNGMIEIYLDNNLLLSIPSSKFNTEANNLFATINTSGTGIGAFEVPSTEAFISSIYVNKLKAPSTEKSDINIQIHDVNTGYEKVVGFSIKSELGMPPTLLNASNATNFIYNVKGIDAAQVTTINSIETRTKIKDRMSAIFAAGGSLEFERVENDTFSENLTMIDSRMPSVAAQMLIGHYADAISRCSSLALFVSGNIPAPESTGFHYASLNPKFYEHNIKEMLCSIALGMKPATSWDGTDEASGGYIIVRTNGDVLAYHIYNRDAFKTYLLNNTKLETPSSTRHGFGALYTEGGQLKMKLNLQIRFV